ncbi:hypothetical protein DM02DRAFT_672331 [Periconia macrospinosa]|uniref:Mid2 domain-containing protein n=1 Tax=Periconia macrospinosa TaxID=97972 RepID=A0A2V1DNZ2_9PLEO|nr:hypothetical protein DM02DRAFT_672331 [Periconia macrospinosa]
MSCYSRNGTVLTQRNSINYIPCNVTALEENKHTSCCAVGDLCLTNGLCRSQDDEKHQGNQYFRVGCTDKSWNDPACADVCEGKETGGLSARVFNCLVSESWCCSLPETGNTNQVNMACCSNQDYTFKHPDPIAYTTANFSTPRVSSKPSAPEAPQQSSSLPPSLPSTGAPVSIPTSASPQSDTLQTPTQAPSSDNASVKVGLGVGLTLGFLLIAAVVALVIMLRRKKTNERGDRDGTQKRNIDDEGQYHQHSVHELQSNYVSDLSDVKKSSPQIQYYAHHATPTKNPFESHHYELDSKNVEAMELQSSPGLKQKF